jgi:Uma2 family endonuclease
LVAKGPSVTQELYKTRPCLIVEVLSPSTERTDRREKWLVYREIPSLRYYLLVGSSSRRVEYYARDAEDEWQMALLDPGASLSIVCSDYRAKLTIDDLYEDVRLPT